MINPYNDVTYDIHKRNNFIRTFDCNVSDDELVWHRDKRNRTVLVLQGMGWKFQFDDQLPFELQVGDIIYIQKEVFHRIFKGKNNLVLQIEEE